MKERDPPVDGWLGKGGQEGEIREGEGRKSRGGETYTS